MIKDFKIEKEIDRALDILIIVAVHELSQGNYNTFVSKREIIQRIREITLAKDLKIGSGEGKLAASSYYYCLDLLSDSDISEPLLITNKAGDEIKINPKIEKSLLTKAKDYKKFFDLTSVALGHLIQDLEDKNA